MYFTSKLVNAPLLLDWAFLLKKNYATIITLVYHAIAQCLKLFSEGTIIIEKNLLQHALVHFSESTELDSYTAYMRQLNLPPLI